MVAVAVGGAVHLARLCPVQHVHFPFLRNADICLTLW